MSEIILTLFLSIFITLILFIIIVSIMDIYDIIKSIKFRLDSIENTIQDKFDLEAQKNIVRKNNNK